jgi:hypothetical protein|tara:strand:+ start:9662 stop:9898 length:237 start_codon:yes stop_codon:yes gene_type:complete
MRRKVAKKPMKKSKGMARGGRMKSKGYRMGGRMKSKGMAMGGRMKSKGMAKGGKTAKPMTLAQIRSAAKAKGYKLTKA